MTQQLFQKLSQALAKIDRPGSFCVGGSAPVVLPGLEVDGLGPIGLPLAARQAEDLKARCEQAPYGKGKETLVDTSVRRVWRLEPSRFSLTNPAWDKLLRETVRKVQEDLGLERQKLQSHLYELLLYEPGSFFLPHRDGEKLDRMVATLVVVLPSSFQGGELVVRHEGQEQVIDFGGDPFHIHFAAFYADCEHEIRPLREGHRLCLVYNLTLSKSKKPITAPRSSEQVEKIADVLGRWAKEEDAPHKLVVTLGHQYTEAGLTWDALKGVDRARALALAEAARRADCRAYLALLTLHQSGSAEGDYDYGYGRGYEEDDDEEDEGGLHEMGEIFESSLTADHWSDPAGNPLPVGELGVEEDELLDPEALENVEPKEEFEGYTGNAGMTLDRWYRHAAIILWPNNRHFEVLCDAGTYTTLPVLRDMVKQWQEAGPAEVATLRAECMSFAAAIIARWPENPYGARYSDNAESCLLFKAIQALDDLGLIQRYLSAVLPRDAAADPGKSLVQVGRKHGWAAIRSELVAVFQATAVPALARNIRLLETICLAGSGKDEAWGSLCQTLAGTLVAAVERIDQPSAEQDWRLREVNRADVLTGLVRSLLATDQCELLAQLLAHTQARPQTYPLKPVQVTVLTALRPWIEKNVTKSCPALSDWVAACREQLEALTAAEPQPPTDFRRDADISHNCRDCAELKRFLADANEQVHRFTAAQDRRGHLEYIIQQHRCDLDLKTEERGRPYTLVCTKNTASYQARLATYRQDQEYLATVRAIEASLPK